MKCLLALCVLFFSLSAHAGAPNCTGVTDVTSGNSYYADPSDCIIRVNVPFSFTAFTVYLPDGQDAVFTVQNDADYESDHCEDYGDEEYGPFIVCQPRAIEITSTGYSSTIDSENSKTQAGFYLEGYERRQQAYLEWNGSSNWSFTESDWR